MTFDCGGMQDATIVERIRRKFKSLRPRLNERLRRQWAAAEAKAPGWGGISAVVAATGLSHNTIDRGIRELAERSRPGGETTRCTFTPAATSPWMNRWA